jgi:translation initiation factor IF-1
MLRTPFRLFLPVAFGRRESRVVAIRAGAEGLRRRTRNEDALMNEWTELQGPVLKVNGQLMLLVPLEDGGAEFVDCARGVSEVEGPHLKIAIPDWLAGMLRIDEGDIVCVSNWDGKLQIRPSEARLVQ